MATTTILVPLDGSRLGEAALPAALTLAAALPADLELVSVAEHDPMTAGWRLSSERVHEWFVGYLGDICDRIGEVSAVPISTKVLDGSVAERLEERAKLTGAGLIVMATHGRGPVSRAWLGSVADHVMRHVTFPVLLIRPDTDNGVSLDATPQFRRIVIALDGSERAEASLPWATRIGRAFHATYTLVRAVPPHFAPSPYLPHVIEETQGRLEEEATEAHAYVERVRTRLGSEERIVEGAVAVGVQPAAAIVRVAAEERADLIAIATHGRGGLGKLMLGSVADKVLRSATTPVLMIRSPTAP